VGRVPARCVVIGNSNAAIEAAHDAGMRYAHPPARLFCPNPQRGFSHSKLVVCLVSAVRNAFAERRYKSMFFIPIQVCGGAIVHQARVRISVRGPGGSAAGRAVAGQPQAALFAGGHREPQLVWTAASTSPALTVGQSLPGGCLPVSSPSQAPPLHLPGASVGRCALSDGACARATQMEEEVEAYTPMTSVSDWDDQ